MVQILLSTAQENLQAAEPCAHARLALQLYCAWILCVVCNLLASLFFLPALLSELCILKCCAPEAGGLVRGSAWLPHHISTLIKNLNAIKYALLKMNSKTVALHQAYA